MNIKKSLLIWSIISFVLWVSNTFAAGIDHFQVTINPETANTGEALDLTIEAVDKNNITVTDYEWVVLIFSETDNEAELPIALEDNTYTFVSSDLWKIVFEDALKFNSDWLQNIYVYDFNDEDIVGIWEVQINKTAAVENIEIDIISPENGLTIWKNSIKISGTSKKNHQIKITLNWEKEFFTTTNNSGIYEKEITELENGQNIIKAYALDSDNNVIWESNEVSIEVENNNIMIKSVKLTPKEVDSEWSFELEVISNKGLEDVSVIINDVVTKLEESEEEWIYLWKIYAPKEKWDYAIDIVIKDELGHEVKEIWAESLKVNEVELEAAKTEEVTSDEEVIEEKINNEEVDLDIKWLRLIELKNRSILSWEEIKWVENYNIYKKNEDESLELIGSTDENKYEIMMSGEEIKYEYFAVKAEAKDENGEMYEWDLSEATKVQTWPELLILLVLSLLLGFVYVTIKSKKA